METAKSKAEAYVREKCPELKGVDSGRPVGSGYMDYPDIQLHHWLRVLAHIADFTIELYAITDECDVNVRKNDRKYCIKINLSTGQPATEADYQSFLTIVGE